MPIAAGFTFRNNIQPRIFSSGTDDLERRIRLAQLASLEAQPGIEERRIGLQEQGLAKSEKQFDLQHALDLATQNETTRYHVGEEADREEKNRIAREGLAQNLQITHEANQRSMAEAVMTHLPNLIYGGLPQSEGVQVTAETLGRLGYPELATSLATAHKTDTEKKVATALGQIAAVNKTGNTAGLAGIPELKDPDVMSDSRVKALLPSGTSTAPTDTVPAGRKLGKTTHGLAELGWMNALLPGAAATYLGAKGAENVLGRSPTFMKDFLDEFLGKRKTNPQ